MREVWRPVVGHEDYYEVSNAGRIRSKDKLVEVVSKRSRPFNYIRKGRVLLPTKGAPYGYLRVGLYDENVDMTTALVHGVVAAAFIGPRPPGKQTCHRNGNPGDCRLVNLYYGTPKQNAADKERHGRVSRGVLQGSAKLNDAAIRYIKRKPRRLTQKALGAKFGVGQSTISKVLSGDAWRHVDAPNVV